MEFLTSKELSLNPAGYLINNVTKKPVFHAEFVAQQKAAEYVIKLSAAIKGKNFKVGKVDNIKDIIEEVKRAINAAEKVVYATAPSKPTSKVNDELIKFALEFDKFHADSTKVNHINDFMNQFNKITDIEKVGDYFEEKLVKLTKIYNIKEIQKAVEFQIETLG